MPTVDTVALAKLLKDKLKSASVFRGEDAFVGAVSTWIPSGSTLLDLILGGGYPCGRIIELSGAESQVKSTLLEHAFANNYLLGGVNVLLDSESAHSPDRARLIGSSVGASDFVDNILSFDVPTVEDGWESLESYLDIKLANKDIATTPCIIGWDTYVSVPLRDGKDVAYRRASANREGLRRIVNKLSRANTLLFLVNQLSTTMTSYGSSDTESGGRGPKFHASIRIRLKPAGRIDEDNITVGIKVIATTIKNKLFDPYKSVPLFIRFDRGLDDLSANFQYLLEVEKSGRLKTNNPVPITHVGSGGPWFFIYDESGNKISFYGKEFRKKVEEHNLEDHLKSCAINVWNLLNDRSSTTDPNAVGSKASIIP